ncbi:hypothetical protein BH09GEM1_BH09GEM1_42240 [soil metagenome]
MLNGLPTLRLLAKGMRILLPYGSVFMTVVVGISIMSGLTDGNAAAVIGRSAYRSFAGTVGTMVSLLAFFVCVEVMRDYLRHASSSPLYHWPSTVIRTAIGVGVLVAVLWCAGYLIGELLRGVWDGKWLVEQMLRGSIRSAAIGALLGAGAVALEAMTMDRSGQTPKSV